MLSSLLDRFRKQPIDPPINHRVVTSFHKEGYLKYGKRCIESFLEHWPEDVTLFVYAEDVAVEVQHPRVQVIDHLATLEKLKFFRDRYSSNPHANGTSPHNPTRTNDFRWDAIRFTNKVFAITDAICRSKGIVDQLIWLDADTVTHSSIPQEFLNRLAPRGQELAAYLNRKSYPECGWVGYNLNHVKIDVFRERFENAYLSGEFLTLKESHDSFVFWEIVKAMAKNGEAKFKFLGSDRATGHIFINSELGKYLDHLKGDRKEAGKSHQRDLKNRRTEAWWDLDKDVKT